jgi:hypothetical protein
MAKQFRSSSISPMPKHQLVNCDLQSLNLKNLGMVRNVSTNWSHEAPPLSARRLRILNDTLGPLRGPPPPKKVSSDKNHSFIVKRDLLQGNEYLLTNLYLWSHFAYFVSHVNLFWTFDERKYKPNDKHKLGMANADEWKRNISISRNYIWAWL